MITYILESLAFQLVFLLTYDLFLKKETFFQWNRAYLLGTFFLSLVLPWVKIEALQTTMPEELGDTTIFFTQLNGVVLGPEANETGFLQSLPWPYWVFGAGSILAAIWFAYKLLQIRTLRKKGTIVHFVDFTKITVPNSSMAFSFFKSIFLGEEIKKEKERNIMAHELVHVKQWHTLDLLFFELARIAFWFNPLVYVYQNRIAELHEFIADAQAVKRDKKTHYELLLSEAFNTRNISFVNQFFNQSLIKKRIVMLQKGKSKAIWQLKYVLLLPIVFGMLVYTSCENQKQGGIESAESLLLDESVTMDPSGATDKIILHVGDLNALTDYEKEKRFQLLEKLRVNNEITTLELVDKENRSVKIQLEKGMGSNDESSLGSFLEIVDRENGTVKNQVDGDSIKNKDGAISVPFTMIDEVPVFPGCEDAEDKRACFQEKIQTHIRKNFHYPEAAQEQGIQGRVSAIFIMDAEGNVVDIRTRGPHELLEKETERILSRLPQMKPGEHKGKKVEVPFAIPITFILEESDEINTEIQKFGERGEGWVPFADIDEAPVYPGCEDASDTRACFLENIQNHIRKHFNYPQEAQEQGIQGRVAVMFGINADGDIVDIKTKGPSPILESEAERIINRLPKMEPAKQDGKPADVIFSIPITFKLK